MFSLPLLSLLLSIIWPTLVTGDQFSEELLLSPLQSGELHAHFKFTTVHPADLRSSQDWKHYQLLARPLGEVLATYRVQELSLSLTQGLWRAATSGYPVESAPPGAAVSARFLPEVPAQDVDIVWEGLTNALAGLLCASLNKLDKTTGVSPKHSFQPAGAQGANLSSSSSHLRFGLLPKENLCTENLTPWKKLLPCKGRRGLSTLLNSGSIQKHSSYQALLLKVRPVCSSPSCLSLSTEVSQSISLLFHPAIYNGRPENTDWNIKHLFGIGLAGACPVADNSQVFVELSSRPVELTPSPHRELTSGHGSNVKKMAVYDMKVWGEEGRIKNLAGKHQGRHIYGTVRSPILTASRYQSGTGQERGGITAELKNSGNNPVTVVYLEVVPWYLRVYLHTLEVTTGGGQTLLPVSMDYKPGRDRSRPYMLELVLRLPPKSTTTISLQFERSLLRWLEYPPDANHGFYLPSATITTRVRENKNSSLFLAAEDSTMSHSLWGNPAEGSGAVLRLYTETLLVSLPTPDFSMPYNVICLACTVAALAFGPIHNITTKSLELVQPGEEEKGLLGKLLDKLRSLLRKKQVVAAKKEEEEGSNNEEDKIVEDDEGAKEQEAPCDKQREEESKKEK